MSRLSKWQITRQFIKILVQLTKAGKLTPAQSLALHHLPDSMGSDGALYPSHQHIAEMAGVSRRTVIDALNRAYALGVIKRVIRYHSVGRLRVRTSNSYEIILNAAESLYRASQHALNKVLDLSASTAQECTKNKLFKPNQLFHPPRMTRQEMIDWCLNPT